MVQSLLVSAVRPTELFTRAQYFLRLLAPCQSVDLVEDIGAEYLHLAGLGSHAHVRAGLSTRLAA